MYECLIKDVPFPTTTAFFIHSYPEPFMTCLSSTSPEYLTYFSTPFSTSSYSVSQPQLDTVSYTSTQSVPTDFHSFHFRMSPAFFMHTNMRLKTYCVWFCIRSFVNKRKKRFSCFIECLNMTDHYVHYFQYKFNDPFFLNVCVCNSYNCSRKCCINWVVLSFYVRFCFPFYFLIMYPVSYIVSSIFETYLKLSVFNNFYLFKFFFLPYVKMQIDDFFFKKLPFLFFVYSPLAAIFGSFLLTLLPVFYSWGVQASLFAIGGCFLGVSYAFFSITKKDFIFFLFNNFCFFSNGMSFCSQAINNPFKKFMRCNEFSVFVCSLLCVLSILCTVFGCFANGDVNFIMHCLNGNQPQNNKRPSNPNSPSHDPSTLPTIQRRRSIQVYALSAFLCIN